MDLLVGSPRGTQLELRRPVSQEGRVRVAVYEARKRYLPTPIHTLVVSAGWKVPPDLCGRADCGHALTRDSYRGGGGYAQCPEFPAPKRARPRRGDGGSEGADQ